MHEEISVLSRVVYVIVGLGIAAVIYWGAWGGTAPGNPGTYGALANYSQAIRLEPKDATSFYNRGYIYDELGYYERALADYSEAIRLNPKDAAAFCNRARLFALRDEPDEVLSDLQQAFKLGKEIDSTECLDLAKTDNDFDSIRNVPHFQALLAEFDNVRY